MSNKDIAIELKLMLDGNIARIMLSDDVEELDKMCEWAHYRIDSIVSARKNELLHRNV